MTKFYLIALLLAAGAGRLPAQTNTNVTPQPVRSQTVITSTVVFYSNASRQIIYTGHVRVDHPQMILTCEQLTADFPQSGGHIDHMVALTNVVMDSVDVKGQTNHATSDEAIYDFKVAGTVTNETVTLTGNARVENKDDWMTGEPIIWDRVKNSIYATNQVMQFRQSITSMLADTNAPVAKTNIAPTILQSTNLPTANTNFPPEAITNFGRVKTGGKTQ